MKDRAQRHRILGLVIVTLALCYSNCGRINVSTVLDATNLGRNACDTRLKKTFGETYHPFLTSNCTSCHTHTGNFASTDINVAYNSFMSKSLTTINYKAVTQHGSNSNSSALQPQIDAIQPKFKSALADYETCKSSDYGIDIMLTNKTVPVLTDHDGSADAGWETLTWQVETEAVEASKGQQLRAFFKIQVRRFEGTGGAVIGLQFRNPTLTLHSAQAAVQVASLKVYIDDVANDVITAYEYLGTVVDTQTETPLAPGSGAAPVEMVFDTETRIAVQLQGVGAPRVENPIDPGLPVDPIDPGNPLPTRVTFAELIATSGSTNIFNRSCVGCHSAANPQGGLDITNYAMASGLAASIKARMNDATRPMPRSGILDQRSRDIVSVWTDGGTPQN